MELEKPGRKLWKPGQSGNPAGRPKGSKNKITLMKIVLEGELRQQLGPHMAEVLAKALSLAKEGNEQMIKLLVDKTIPTTKASDEETTDKEKIVIQIGRLPERADEPITINGEVIESSRGNQ
jgi:Family of unknown function (DUF5681)